MVPGREPITVKDMNAVEYATTAQTWMRFVEKTESERLGAPVKVARQSISRREKMPIGTIANISDGRVKSIPVHVFGWLRVQFEKALQHEIRKHEHELQMLRQIGSEPYLGEVEQVEAALATLRAALK